MECDFMFLSSRVHLVNNGVTIFNMMDRESQSMAAALTVKAASETLVRFFLAMLDAWGRTDVKVLLRSDQEVTLTLILREVQARRQQRTLVERSPVESHATMVAMERANRTMGEMLRTMKHATETRVGGRLETDHPLISWMIRHCCWVFSRYHVRADGRTPYEVLRNNSCRGGLACFGEIVWARVPGSRLLRGKYEVNWLELVWLGKTEKHGRALVRRRAWGAQVPDHQTTAESARWRREYVEKLSGDPFNPKPKTSMAVGLGEPPVDLQWGTRASLNVIVDEPPGDRAPEPAATHKRWYVTEALVNEHGRTMGCPRCSSGIGIHNAECCARIEGILLQQSRMKPAEVDEPRSGHTKTKSVPMELERPTGPVHHGGSSGSGIQRDDATRTGATRNADARPLEATDVEMTAEDPCAAQVKRAGLEICVLEALDDIFDEPPETPTTLAGTPGENETDEDVVSPEVTEELNRLQTLGRPYIALSVDELMPRTFVYSQKTNEQLDKRMVAESRKRELGALCSQGALFVIPRTALSPCTKMARGRFVDDMKNGRVKSRFVAAEVARDVRHDVHAGTPALKVLRMIVSLAATRDGKHRPRSIAFYDIVAAFVHASIDEVVGVVPQDGLLEKGECFLLLKALYGTRMASKHTLA